MKTRNYLLLLFALMFAVPVFAQKPQKIKDGDCKFKCCVNNLGNMYGKGTVSIGRAIDLSFENIEKVNGKYIFSNASFVFDQRLYFAEEMTLQKSSVKKGQSPNEMVYYTNNLVINKGNVKYGSSKYIILPEWPVKFDIVNSYKVLIGQSFDGSDIEINANWFEQTPMDDNLIATATKSDVLYKNMAFGFRSNTGEFSNSPQQICWNYKTNSRGIYGATPNGYMIEGNKDTYTIISPNKRNNFQVSQNEIKGIKINYAKLEIADKQYDQYYNNAILCLQSRNTDGAWRDGLSPFYGMLALKDKEGNLVKKSGENILLQYAKIWSDIDNYSLIPYCGCIYKADNTNNLESYLQNKFSYEPDILSVEAYYKNGEKTSHATIEKNYKDKENKFYQAALKNLKRLSGTWVCSINNKDTQIKVVLKISPNCKFSFDMQGKNTVRKIAPLTGRVYETETIVIHAFANNQDLDGDEKKLSLSYNVSDVQLGNSYVSVNGSKRPLDVAESIELLALPRPYINGIFTPNASATILTNSNGHVFKRVGGGGTAKKGTSKTNTTKRKK